MLAKVQRARRGAQHGGHQVGRLGCGRSEGRTGRWRVGRRAAGRTARVRAAVVIVGGRTGEGARTNARPETTGAQHRVVGGVEHRGITDRYGHHFVCVRI